MKIICAMIFAITSILLGTFLLGDIYAAATGITMLVLSVIDAGLIFFAACYSIVEALAKE